MDFGFRKDRRSGTKGWVTRKSVPLAGYAGEGVQLAIGICVMEHTGRIGPCGQLGKADGCGAIDYGDGCCSHRCLAAIWKSGIGTAQGYSCHPL